MNLLETERLKIREVDETDADFILDLLNQPSFIKNIGDRNVRTVEESREFIENRFRASYKANGFGLYTVELKENAAKIGICGFVKRDFLPQPDLGFALLPQYERRGYAFESALEMLKYGRETLGFDTVLAITSLHNEASGNLLRKLDFREEKVIESPPSNELLRLFISEKSS